MTTDLNIVFGLARLTKYVFFLELIVFILVQDYREQMCRTNN